MSTNWIVDDWGTMVAFDDLDEALAFFTSRRDCLKDEHRNAIRFYDVTDITGLALA